MKIQTLSIICCLLIFTTACKKDDDDNSNEPNQPNNPVSRVETFNYTFNGEFHETDDIQIQFSSSPEALDIVSEFPNGAMSQLEMSPIRDEGTYSTGSTLGFGIAIGTEAWLCNSGCTVVVHEHDEDDGWYDVTVSGELQSLTTSATATLDEARISVFYE